MNQRSCATLHEQRKERDRERERETSEAIPRNLADQTVPEEHLYDMVHHDIEVVGRQRR